ncbi:MAG: DUF6282 family protein [bacterium]
MRKEKYEEESLQPVWKERAKLSYSTVEKYGARQRITEEDVAQVMKGAIDIHVHGYPEALVDTGWDFAEIAKRAYDAGMRAIVCKSMYSDTAPMAYFVQQVIDDYAENHTTTSPHAFNVFGGIVLNYSVGGLNPIAVKTSAKLGAKIVWLPSHDSAHHKKVLGEQGGIEVLTGNDEIRPELKEIFKIIVDYDIILDLCHTSTKERMIITEEAKKFGVKKILITHPQWSVNRASPGQQVEMAKLGAYIGLYLYSAIPHFNNPTCDRTEFLEIIEKVGVDKTVLATDFGSMLNPHPVEGMKLYIRLLIASGIGKESLDIMLKRNPAWLLGIKYK